MLIFAGTNHRGSQIFFSVTHLVLYLVMERSRKKKCSVTQMMFVVIQLIISYKKIGWSACMGARMRASIGAPLLENQKSI